MQQLALAPEPVRPARGTAGLEARLADMAAGSELESVAGLAARRGQGGRALTCRPPTCLRSKVFRTAAMRGPPARATRADGWCAGRRTEALGALMEDVKSGARQLETSMLETVGRPWRQSCHARRAWLTPLARPQVDKHLAEVRRQIADGVSVHCADLAAAWAHAMLQEDAAQRGVLEAGRKQLAEEQVRGRPCCAGDQAWSELAEGAHAPRRRGTWTGRRRVWSGGRTRQHGSGKHWSGGRPVRLARSYSAAQPSCSSCRQ
jgi:hypothetical protein